MCFFTHFITGTLAQGWSLKARLFEPSEKAHPSAKKWTNLRLIYHLAPSRQVPSFSAKSVSPSPNLPIPSTHSVFLFEI
jgi:hypothetical protein